MRKGERMSKYWMLRISLGVFVPFPFFASWSINLVNSKQINLNINDQTKLLHRSDFGMRYSMSSWTAKSRNNFVDAWNTPDDDMGVIASLHTVEIILLVKKSWTRSHCLFSILYFAVSFAGQNYVFSVLLCCSLWCLRWWWCASLLTFNHFTTNCEAILLI